MLNRVLTMTSGTDVMKEVTFPFDLSRDTPAEVASEMASNLGSSMNNIDEGWLTETIETCGKCASQVVCVCVCVRKKRALLLSWFLLI